MPDAHVERPDRPPPGDVLDVTEGGRSALGPTGTASAGRHRQQGGRFLAGSRGEVGAQVAVLLAELTLEDLAGRADRDVGRRGGEVQYREGRLSGLREDRVGPVPAAPPGWTLGTVRPHEGDRHHRVAVAAGDDRAVLDAGQVEQQDPSMRMESPSPAAVRTTSTTRSIWNFD